MFQAGGTRNEWVWLWRKCSVFFSNLCSCIITVDFVNIQLKLSSGYELLTEFIVVRTSRIIFTTILQKIVLKSIKIDFIGNTHTNTSIV